MNKQSKKPPKPTPKLTQAKPGEPEQITETRALVVTASRKLRDMIEDGQVEPIQLAVIIREGMESLTAHASLMGDGDE